MKMEDAPKAIDAFKKAVEKSGSRSTSLRADIYLWLGRALAANKQHALAIDAYGEGLAANAAVTATYYFLGLSLIEERKMPEAREAFVKYLRADPTGQYADRIRDKAGELN
jgi:tetratricopeptide (TPR) repeat protein